MPTFYLDPEGGNDSNDGTTFANRWKTVISGATAARIAPGDEVRVIASPPKTDTGINATFTDGSPTVTLASALNALITDCETNWTAVTNVTCSTSTTRRTGSNAVQIAIAAGFTTGKVAYSNLGGTFDFSAYQGITFWLHSSITIADGTFTIKLCSDTTGDTVVDSFTIPPQGTMTTQYRPIYIDKGSALGSAIQSIAIYADSDPGTQTLLVDNFSTVKAQGASQTDNLNLGSLIAAGNTGHWYAIRGINGTAVTLEASPAVVNATQMLGWAGSTGSVDLYKRETVKYPISVSALNLQLTIQDGGTSVSPITFSGGWNRSDMSSQDDETWLDGQWANVSGWAEAFAKDYYIIDKINMVRWYVPFDLNATGAKVSPGGTVQVAACSGASFDLPGCVDLEIGNIVLTGGSGNQGITIQGTVRAVIGDVVAHGYSQTGLYALFYNNNNAPIFATVGDLDIRRSGIGAFYLGSEWYGLRCGNITHRNCTVEVLEAESAGNFTNIELGDVFSDACTAGSTSFRFPRALATGLRNRFGDLHVTNGTNAAFGGVPGPNTFVKAMRSSGNSYGINILGDANIPFGRARVGLVDCDEATPFREQLTNDPRSGAGMAWIEWSDYQGTGLKRIDHGTISDSASAVIVTEETGANRHTLSGSGWKLAVLDGVLFTSTFPGMIPLGEIYVAASALVTLRLYVNRSNTGLSVRLAQPGGQIGGVAADVTDTAVASASSWEELEITFTPNESGLIRPELRFWTAGTTYSVYFDDMTILQA